MQRCVYDASWRILDAGLAACSEFRVSLRESVCEVVVTARAQRSVSRGYLLWPFARSESRSEKSREIISHFHFTFTPSIHQP
eukprot:scaffold85555_cov23-Cyclotella_meneghiniana.AAC.2